MGTIVVILVVVVGVIIFWRLSTQKRDEWTEKCTNEYMQAEKIYIEAGKASKEAESELESSPEDEETLARFYKADVSFQQVAKQYCIVASRYCKVMSEVWGYKPDFKERFKPLFQIH